MSGLGKRLWLMAPLLAMAWGAQVAGAQAAVLAATPIARSDLPWWKARYEQKQQAIASGTYGLVYYGDSITQNFEGQGKVAGSDWAAVWAHYYGDRHALNLGFKGDTTASLLWRVENGEGDVKAPKVAIVLIGANNMGRLHWPAADTTTGIEADVTEIQRHLPKTRVLLISVLPSKRSDWVDQTTATVNAALAQRYGMAGTSGRVVFVDVSHVLQKNGATDVSLFIDPELTPPDPPLHPSQEGASRVAAAIEPVLAGMLGDHPH